MKIALVCSQSGHLTEMKQIEIRLRDADRFKKEKETDP